MSLLLCKNCNSKYSHLKGHYCLNGQWIPGVADRNGPPQPLAGDLANLRAESTLAAQFEVDTSGAEAVNTLREFFNENLLSNQVIYENLNPNSSNHGLATVGTSNRLMTIDYGHSHIGECSRGSSNDQAFNINVPDANDLYMPIRHGFPNSEIPLNLDGLTGRISEMGLDDASLCIPSISNTSLNMPFFPPMNISNDGMITNQIPPGYEFQNVEPHTTMQNDALKYINRTVEESHDYDMSEICYESPAINKNVITWPQSLNETETEKNIENNQWLEIDRLFSVNGQSSQNIPIENAFESTTENFTNKEFETGWPSMFSGIPAPESSFYYGSINDRVRLGTTTGAILGNTSPNAPTACKIGLNDTTFVTGHKESTLMSISLGKKSDCFEESPSDYVHALPGPSFSQPNERNKLECSKRSLCIGNTEPPAVLNISAKRFICSVCQRAFKRKSNLRIHMNIHESIRPYKCNFCEKSFTRKGSLNSHALIHTGERPFECEVCKKTFRQKSSKFRHALIHTGVRPFKCDVCKQTFKESGNLKRHVLIHTGVRPFKCDVCKQTFTESGNLKKHALIHKGDRPFKCDVCKKTFVGSGNLKKHAQIHTGQKLFKCEICKKSFTYQYGLKRHSFTHTDKPFGCG